MIAVDTLTTQISYKLQDVNNLVYSTTLIRDYIQRGYIRMIRVIKAVDESLLEAFADYYKEQTLDFADYSNGYLIPTTLPSSKIISLVVNGSLANLSTQKEFFDLEKSTDKGYKNPNKKNIFYSIISKKLKVLPAPTTTDRVEVLYINTYFTEQAPIVAAGSNLDLPADYQDILISLASVEAMYDKGDEIALQKAQIYLNDAKGQIELMQLNKANKG